MNIHNEDYRYQILNNLIEHGSPDTLRSVYEIFKEYATLTDINNDALFKRNDMAFYNVCLLELETNLDRLVNNRNVH